MATLNGEGYTKAYVNVPREKYSGGNFAADMKVHTEEYDLSAAVSQNDIINLFKVTKQGRIVGGFFKCDDMGSAGAFKLGYTGDDDAILTAADVSTATGKAKLFYFDGVAMGEVLDENTIVFLTCTETTNATSGSLKVVLFIAEP